jgi:hypothetical protein
MLSSVGPEPASRDMPVYTNGPAAQVLTCQKTGDKCMVLAASAVRDSDIAG